MSLNTSRNVSCDRQRKKLGAWSFGGGEVRSHVREADTTGGIEDALAVCAAANAVAHWMYKVYLYYCRR